MKPEVQRPTKDSLRQADEKVAALIADVEAIVASNPKRPEDMLEPLVAITQRYRAATILSALLQQTIRLRSRR